MKSIHFVLIVMMGGWKNDSLALCSTTRPYKESNQQLKQLKTKQLKADATTTTKYTNGLDDYFQLPNERYNLHYQQQQQQQQRQQQQHYHNDKLHQQLKNLFGPLYISNGSATTVYLQNVSKYPTNEPPRMKNLAKRKISYATTTIFPYLEYTYNAQSPFNYITNDVSYVSENVVNTNVKPTWSNGQQHNIYNNNNNNNNELSKQLRYAPKRSKIESQLAVVQNVIPYPPSFITFTTTTTTTPFDTQHSHYRNERIEKDAKQWEYALKSLQFHVPDFFANRQYNSLLDSYIPSWQVIKMMQNYNRQLLKDMQTQRTNDLHTLAFVKPFKKHQSKRSLQRKLLMYSKK